jgi:transcriptional regulator with XRE-family HTH domain
MKKNATSPFDRDIGKRLKEDPEYAAAYLEELAKAPLPLQLAILRRLRGMTQEKMAAKLHVNQAYISKLEKPGSDHLLSNYERAVRMLHGHLAIIPNGARVVTAPVSVVRDKLDYTEEELDKVERLAKARGGKSFKSVRAAKAYLMSL